MRINCVGVDLTLLPRPLRQRPSTLRPRKAKTFYTLCGHTAMGKLTDRTRQARHLPGTLRTRWSASNEGLVRSVVVYRYASHRCSSPDTSFVNPEDQFWSLYLTQAQAQDKQRIERWKGDSDGILIFVRSRHFERRSRIVRALILRLYRQVSLVQLWLLLSLLSIPLYLRMMAMKPLLFSLRSPLFLLMERILLLLHLSL